MDLKLTFSSPVASKPVTRNLELLGTISEAQEAKDPKKNTDGLGTDKFDRADLANISVPIHVAVTKDEKI